MYRSVATSSGHALHHIGFERALHCGAVCQSMHLVGRCADGGRPALCWPLHLRLLRRRSGCCLPLAQRILRLWLLLLLLKVAGARNAAPGHPQRASPGR